MDCPKLNPNRKNVTGTICNVKIQDIEDEMIQDIRIMDKLVDDIAKGKKKQIMEKLDVLKQGRPLDCDLKVKLYYDILDDLQIAYQRLDLKDLSLNEDIKRIDDILETRAIKNLLFRTLSKRNQDIL